MRVALILVVIVLFPISVQAQRAQVFDTMMQVCKEYILSDPQIARSLFRAHVSMSKACECGNTLFVSELTSSQVKSIQQGKRLSNALANRNKNLIANCVGTGAASDYGR